MARKVNDEAPEITPELFAKMRPMKTVTPGMADAVKAARGRPKVANPKQVVSIRLSAPAMKRWSEMSRERRAKLVATLEKEIARSTRGPAR
jgi:uncharacterized protein (DUF4415 family)